MYCCFVLQQRAPSRAHFAQVGWGESGTERRKGPKFKRRGGGGSMCRGGTGLGRPLGLRSADSKDDQEALRLLLLHFAAADIHRRPGACLDGCRRPCAVANHRQLPLRHRPAAWAGRGRGKGLAAGMRQVEQAGTCAAAAAAAPAVQLNHCNHPPNMKDDSASSSFLRPAAAAAAGAAAAACFAPFCCCLASPAAALPLPLQHDLAGCWPTAAALLHAIGGQGSASGRRGSARGPWRRWRDHAAQPERTHLLLLAAGASFFFPHIATAAAAARHTRLPAEAVWGRWRRCWGAG